MYAGNSKTEDTTPAYLFTVLTSTYNSAHTLHRPYESLLAQTLTDFEWVIVDAGSDETESLVKAWCNQSSPFPIRYFRKENLGKHGAINLGVHEARGSLFVILDADDECVSDALERFSHHWNSIPEPERGRFAGVGVLCRDQNGTVTGTKFPFDVVDADFLELWHRYKVRGEKWLCVRTDVMREFPFPEEPTFRSIPESVVLFRMARKYKTRWVNEVLRIYWISPESISRRFDPSVVAGPVSILHRTRLNEQLDWFRFAPVFYMRSAIHYSRFSFHRGLGLRGQASQLKGIWAKLLWAAMLPLGFLVYLKERV